MLGGLLYNFESKEAIWITGTSPDMGLKSNSKPSAIQAPVG